MGTEYIILKDISGTEVSISEMSNRLELTIRDLDYGDAVSTEDMTPEEMLKGFMEGIKSISYWMSKEDFNRVFSKLEVYPF